MAGPESQPRWKMAGPTHCSFPSLQTTPKAHEWQGQHLAGIFSFSAPFRNRTVLTCCETKVLEQAISTH